MGRARQSNRRAAPARARRETGAEKRGSELQIHALSWVADHLRVSTSEVWAQADAAQAAGMNFDFPDGVVTIEADNPEVWSLSADTVCLYYLEAQPSATGHGKQVVEALRAYCDQHKRKLRVVAVSEDAESYWAQFGWLKRLRHGGGSSEYGYRPAS